MLILESDEARVEWNNEIIFATVSSSEVKVLKMIEGLVDKHYYWLYKAVDNTSDEAYSRCSEYANTFKVEASDICKVLNTLWDLYNEIHWYMFASSEKTQ